MVLKVNREIYNQLRTITVFALKSLVMESDSLLKRGTVKLVLYIRTSTQTTGKVVSGIIRGILVGGHFVGPNSATPLKRESIIGFAD